MGLTILLSYCGECGVPVQRKPPGRWPKRCTPCQAEAVRERDRHRYAENPGPKRERSRRRRRIENAETKREYGRHYRAANAEAIREYRQTPAGRAAAARAHSKRRGVLEAEDTPLTVAEWYRRLEMHGHKCAVCRAPWEHIDHIVPISRGGGHTFQNIWPLCAPCNLTKSNKDLLVWLEPRWRPTTEKSAL